MVKAIRLAIRVVAGVIALIFVSYILFPPLRHQIHWLRSGHDRVWYHNRDYVNPHEYTAQEVDKQFGQGQDLIPTGNKIIGLPVYDTPRSLAFQTQKHVVSTLLFLKQPNGGFIVYELSGGP